MMILGLFTLKFEAKSQTSISAPWLSSNWVTSRGVDYQRMNVYFNTTGYASTEINFAVILSDASGIFSNSNLISSPDLIQVGSPQNYYGTYEIPRNLPSGSNYKIKIVGPDELQSSASDYIRIQSGELSANKTTFCMGDSAILTSIKPQLDNANVIYNWRRIDSENSATLYGHPIFLDSFATVYQSGKYFAEIYIDNGNNNQTYFCNTDTIEITAHQFPHFTITAQNGNLNEGITTFCGEVPTSFSINDLGTGANAFDFLYEWKQNNGSWQGDYDPNVGDLVLSNLENGSFLVRPKVNHSCGIDTNILQLQILPRLNTNFAFQTSACAAKLVTMPENTMDDPNNPGNGYEFSYSWDIQPSPAYSNLPIGSNESIGDKYFSNTTPGNHTVILTVNNYHFGCSASDTVVVGIDSLVVWANDIIKYEYIPTGAKAFASGGTAPYTFNWTGVDSCLSLNCDSAKITNDHEAIYVSATDGMGCSSGDLAVVLNVKSTDHPMAPLMASLFADNPNLTIEDLNNGEKQFQKYMDEQDAISRSKDQPLNSSIEKVYIPVVFGIIDIAMGGNIHTSMSVAKIDENLAQVNSWYSQNIIQTPEGLKIIQFCRAKNKPNNLGSFDGIIRETHPTLWKSTYYNRNEHIAAMNLVFNKPTEIYSPLKYCRILVLDYGFTGFAKIASQNPYYTTQNRNETDGPVLDYRLFGKRADGLPGDGASLAHELGHYLDLHHPFSDKKLCRIRNPNGTFVTVCPNSAEALCFEPAGYCSRAETDKIQKVYYRASFCDALTSCPACSTVEEFFNFWDFVSDTKQFYNPFFNNMPYPIDADEMNNRLATAGCEGINFNAISDDDKKYSIQNIMNYGQTCMELGEGYGFTPGQERRLYYAIKYYRPELISRQNMVDTKPGCLEPIPFFTVSSKFACANQTTINLKPYDNSVYSGSLNFEWILSDEDASLSTGTGSEDRILTINTNTPRTFTITLKISASGNDYFYSENISVSPVCYGGLNSKSNLFFGRYAGIAATNNSKIPSPNLGAYNANPKTISSNGGSVTVNSASGNLLFYAAGPNLWNSQHKLVTSTILSENLYSQYGIAIPSPANTTDYWLFTVPAPSSTSANLQKLYYHKINKTNINNTTSPLTGSTLNHEIEPPSGAPSGFSSKITIVPSCEQGKYWLVVQGPSSSSVWGKRFYVYSVSATGVVYTAFYDAVYTAPSGVLKHSPNTDFLVSTYTSINEITGFGTGEKAILFNFNSRTGEISERNKIVLEGTNPNSYFGASFTADNNYIYLNSNSLPSSFGSTEEVAVAGIYRATILGTSSGTEITSQPVSLKEYEVDPNIDLVLDADNRILVAKPLNKHIQNELTQNWDPSVNPLITSSEKIGIIYNPSIANPYLDWDGIPLTTSNQEIRSIGGLGNFVDGSHVPRTFAGQTLPTALELGQNPGSFCCITPPSIINVNCTGNENEPATTGNDVFYEFSLKRNNSNVFTRPLRVDISGSDFAVTSKLKFFNTDLNPDDWDDVPGSFIDEVLNIPIGDLNDLNSADETIQFRLTVDANSTSASGNFVVKVNYRDFTAISCCRLAVSQEGFENGIQKELELDEGDGLLSLFPNPAKDQIILETVGGWDNFKIMDMNGRLVWEGQLEKGQNNLDTRKFQNGLYRILIAGKPGVKSLGFQVLR